MDQVKIGRFIAERRKIKNLTQAQLAEKLNITDRAVSKWETGKSLPDSSIMLELCDILNITVNDLLCGEVVTMENYNKEMENKLDHTGMYVRRSGQLILQANNRGVEAADVTVRNYLTVGQFARLEDYQTNRTACFYIGGTNDGI